MYHEDVISVLGTDRSQREQYQANNGDDEGFQIHIQLQQSWQLVTCGQESVFLTSFLQFPGVAASMPA